MTGGSIAIMLPVARQIIWHMNDYSVSNYSDSRALVERARQGDADARARLHVLFAPRVRAYARDGLHAASPDTLAEATLDEAFARIADFDPDAASFDTWLKHIAARRHRARKHSQRLAFGGLVVFLTVLGLALLLLSPPQSTSAFPGSGNPGAMPLERPTRPAGPTPVPATPVPTLVPAAGPRVTVLVLGVDYRPGEAEPPRSDVVMLMSLDPATGDAAVLSIPRDLYVDIPGYGPNRINTAYYFGEMYSEPGGGPGLASRTVENAFGVHIDHWVVFRFAAFERSIDMLGGIDVNVPKEIYDPAYPTGNYGTEVFTISAGAHHLNGETALKYVRTRHGDNDLERNARQRATLLAIKKRLSDPAALARLLPQLPGFIGSLGENLQSDLSVPQMLQLGMEGLKVDSSKIRQLAIGSDAVSDYTTAAGAQVLQPNWDAVHAILQEFLDGPCQACPEPTAERQLQPSGHAAAVAPPDPLAALRAENARVQVLNGTTVPGLAETVAQRLRQAGVNVVSVTDAVRQDYPATYLFVYGQAPATAKAIAGLLDIGAREQYTMVPTAGGYDLQVIVGADYAQP